MLSLTDVGNFNKELDCKPLLKKPITKVRSLAWSPDRKTLAVGMADKEIRLLDDKLNHKKTLPLPVFAQRIVWRPDNSGMMTNTGTKLFYVPVNGDKVTELEHVAQGTPEWRTGDVNTMIAWNPDGTRVVYSAKYPSLYRFEGQKPILVPFTNYAGGWQYSPKWSPNGSRFVFSDRFPTHAGLNLFSADGEFVKRLTAVKVFVSEVKVSPKGDRLAVLSNDGTALDGNILQVFSIDGELLSTTKLKEPASYVDWHPDGEHILCDGYEFQGSHSPHVVVHWRTQRVVARTPSGNCRYVSALFEPTRGDVVAILMPNEIKFWRWKVEKVPQQGIPVKNGHRASMWWLPDGKGILQSGQYETPTLWSVAGKRLATIDGAKDCYARAVSADGSRILFSNGKVFAPDGNLIGTPGCPPSLA